jgi:PBP1b-binding outer membrane lipoprotein LpoB
MGSRTLFLLLAALLAAACSNQAGAPSAEQNREMENAAEILDEASERLSQIDDRELLQDGANQGDPKGDAAQE